MSDFPTTFRAEPGDHAGPGWNDEADLHRADDGGGVLHGMKKIRSGTLAELVRLVMTMPEDERRRYAILKAGDHRMNWPEISALARRRDYPG